MAVKINYGIDAPKVIRNLIVIGVILYVVGFFVLPYMQVNWLLFVSAAFFYTGIFLIIEGLLMIWYSKYGKLKHRDRMLKLYPFAGNETVLDVGTGRGLLMIGAAKQLKTGHAIGIDIWNDNDLSGNNKASALQNAQLEGVPQKVEILNKNILNTGFDSDSFDLVLSNLCLHNIYDVALRQKACEEIFRILKPDGVALISDFKHTSSYQKNFAQLGMKTQRIGTYIFSTFPALTIIEARKI